MLELSESVKARFVCRIPRLIHLHSTLPQPLPTRLLTPCYSIGNVVRTKLKVERRDGKLSCILSRFWQQWEAIPSQGPFVQWAALPCTEYTHDVSISQKAVDVEVCVVARHDVIVRILAGSFSLYLYILISYASRTSSLNPASHA